MGENNILEDMLLNFNSKPLPLDKQQQTTKMEGLTIAQLFEQFPEIKSKFKWTEKDILVLLDSKLLIGKVESDKVSITKSSMQKLIEYRNNIK